MSGVTEWRLNLAQGLQARRRALEALEPVLGEGDAAEARSLLEDLERAAQRARPAGVVALVGPSGAGKSSLFNALLGEQASEVSAVRPTTRGLIAAEAEPGLAEELLGHALCSRGEVRRVRSLGSFEAPVVLVDGPDHNSHAQEHRQLSCELVERADLVLVVTHPQGIVELAGLRFLARFLGRRRVVGILGHVEAHSLEDREALLEQLHGVLAEALGQAPAAVLPVDGRRTPGAEAAEGVGAPPGRDSGDAAVEWGTLRAVLGRELRAGALGRLLQANAEGAEDRLSRLAQRAAARLASREQEETAALDGALARWSEGLALRVQASVEASAGGWRTVSRQGLAEGLRGLGGALLRRSWGQLGALATGGLLLRRSPLVGAGALAAGVLASRRQGPEPMTPGLLSEPELIEVARLGAAAGEEALEAWVGRSRGALSAAQASWEATQQAGGSRVGLFIARMLLELPLALLALRAVALALLGMVTGPGFGVDGLVDTLLVGVAGAAGWRLAMGAWSDRGARGAQERLLAEVARATEEEARQVRGLRAASGAEQRAALLSLAGGA
ncbi:MAG: 50S ribosome-binding GTPase [Planctomycetes bacterium]|nr:50S ribosome-binding GTPase [Planctomycetota bacterium]